MQGVQDCTCECPRSQAGTTAAIYRRECHSRRALTLRFMMLVVRSFNGVVQCTIDCTGHVLHARTDRDVHVSDPWHTASDVTFCPFLCHREPRTSCVAQDIGASDTFAELEPLSRQKSCIQLSSKESPHRTQSSPYSSKGARSAEPHEHG